MPTSRRWLKAELAGRFKVPVKYVVYSHHHWDHASGGDVFADTARFVGHANMLSHLALPPPSTTLSQVVGEFGEVAKLDANRNGVVEKAEAPANVPFDAYDANRDGVLSGAEVMRETCELRPSTRHHVQGQVSDPLRRQTSRTELGWQDESLAETRASLPSQTTACCSSSTSCRSGGCRTGKWTMSSGNSTSG